MRRRWFIRRVTTSLVVLFTSMIVNFAIPRMMPGDILGMFTGGASLTEEARQAIIKRFGLDASLWEQFYRYVINAVRGDFGLSFTFFPKSVNAIVMETLPWTVLLVLSSLILQSIIGYVLGVESAWKAGYKTDSFLQTFSMAILSIPMFWVAMVLLYVFGFYWQWFPLSGAVTAGATYSGTLDYLADILKHAALPIIAMTIAQYGIYQLVMRNTMVGVLNELYILTAEAKGLSETRIKHCHAARNALLPMITFIGVSVAINFGSSVYVETVFSYPGIGKLIYDSVMNRDYPVLQGCFFMFSLVIIAANFLVDLIYMYLDPRIGL